VRADERVDQLALLCHADSVTRPAAAAQCAYLARSSRIWLVADRRLTRTFR